MVLILHRTSVFGGEWDHVPATVMSDHQEEHMEGDVLPRREIPDFDPVGL